jgi:hypothetical protein
MNSCELYFDYSGQDERRTNATHTNVQHAAVQHIKIISFLLWKGSIASPPIHSLQNTIRQGTNHDWSSNAPSQKLTFLLVLTGSPVIHLTQFAAVFCSATSTTHFHS